MAVAFILPIASAQAITPLDKASFSLGLAIPDDSTKIDFNANVSGTPINLKRDLGLETDNFIATMSATWRPWENHEFGFGYFTNNASRTRALADPIEWDGVVYDGTVKTKIDVSTSDLSYIWWGLNKENYALGPMLRLSYITLDAQINLAIDADGVPVLDDSFKRTENTDIPAPTIGFAWRWVPADQWRLNMNAGYMQASFGEFDGSALVASGGIAWFPVENWGFSLNALYMNFDVNKTNLNFDGNINVKQSNYNLGVTYRF